ncbi:MAG: hypothetical protein LBT55_00440 [Clostridiaceae bacterium]|nr:hypothetical protein [Clostridiaceae bacterium]
MNFLTLLSVAKEDMTVITVPEALLNALFVFGMVICVLSVLACIVKLLSFLFIKLNAPKK